MIMGLFPNIIRVVCAVICAVLFMPFISVYAQTATGTEIRNTATISFNQGSGRLTLTTNEVVLVLEAERTTSTIEFFRFAPNSNNGITTMVNGSQFSPSGDLNGPFIGIGAPVSSNGLVVDLSGPVTLTPATRYLAGELMFIRVQDPGQNSSPSTIETLSVRIIASTGDEIVLQLSLIHI